MYSQMYVQYLHHHWTEGEGDVELEVLATPLLRMLFTERQVCLYTILLRVLQ